MNTMPRPHWITRLIGLAIIFLTSCQGQPAVLAQSPATITPRVKESTSDSIQDGEQEQTDYRVIQREYPSDSRSKSLSESTKKQPAIPPDLFQFTFPLPGPAPVSAWRPPLYPVPWALTPYDHFYFTRPIAADEINWPLADYRYAGAFFDDIVHSGVDIPADAGTQVLAAASGKITWAGYGLYSGYFDPEDPYGQAVLIRHDFGYQGETLYTAYGHLDRVDVVKGQRVEIGEQIGLSGQTGKATGPHLHFEVRFGKDAIFYTRNPELWLVPPQGWGVLAGRVMNTGGALLEGQLVIVRSLNKDQVIQQGSGQTWRAYSYAFGPVHSDPYYRENLVISDLPAGRYTLEINYLSRIYTWEIQIEPGLVTTFVFRGRSGFVSEPTPLPPSNFIP